MSFEFSQSVSLFDILSSFLEIGLVLSILHYLVGNLLVLTKFQFKKIKFQIQGIFLSLKFCTKHSLISIELTRGYKLLFIEFVEQFLGFHVVLNNFHVNFSGVKFSLLVKLSLLLLNNNLVLIFDSLKLRIDLHSKDFSLAILLLTVSGLQVFEQRA